MTLHLCVVCCLYTIFAAGQVAGMICCYESLNFWFFVWQCVDMSRQIVSCCSNTHISIDALVSARILYA